MGSTSTCQFVHRDNRNGTFDSICRECFVTAATAVSEEELAKAEQAHVCNRWERLDSSIAYGRGQTETRRSARGRDRSGNCSA